jgi:hypothetical protein
MADDDELKANSIEAKKAKLREAMEETTIADIELVEPADLTAAMSLYDRFKVGDFQYLNRNRSRWIPPGDTWHGPDLFEYIPKKVHPFMFVRSNGETVAPRNMITDIGTIPRLAGLLRRGLTSWGYAPAYICHDWEFELHHCQKTNKSFDQVCDTMMECVKTLMEKYLAPKSMTDFWLLYQGINSKVAHHYWDRNPPKCTLPPDDPE